MEEISYTGTESIDASHHAFRTIIIPCMNRICHSELGMYLDVEKYRIADGTEPRETMGLRSFEMVWYVCGTLYVLPMFADTWV